MSFETVVIGAADGGLKALQSLLWGVPEAFPLPLVIVYHRRRDSELGLCEFLRGACRVPLSEPEDKDPILPRHAYLAPRDYHLLIEDHSFALSTEKPVTFARPSIDVLFESAAEAHGRGVIAALLTSDQSDGVHGLGTIHRRGGMTLLATDDSIQRRPTISEVELVVPVSRMAAVLNNLVSPAHVSYGT